ncbi:hypothetical protein STANM309S_05877 [Streptomyces tanashiensis]
MPSPNVTRPEVALAISAKTPASAAHSGLRTDPAAQRTSVSRPAEIVPAIIIVVRTPRTDIRYGDTTLYDTGCMPPYQVKVVRRVRVLADELGPRVRCREIAAAVGEREEPDDVKEPGESR